MPTKSAMRGNLVTLQDAATTGNGTVIAIPDSFKHHRIAIQGAADVTSGAIQIESANVFDYAGTWAPISGGPISVGNNTQLGVDFQGVYKFIRARISTTVAGGASPSVTVTYVGS